MTAKASPWPGRDSELRALWPDLSISTREIGRRMGLGKNAVVGRANRLHLTPRPSHNRPAPTTRAARKPFAERERITAENRLLADGETLPRPRQATGPGVAAPPPRPPEPVTILRAHRSEPCCAPIGTPGSANFWYCGQLTSGRYRAPYCDFHAAQFLRVRVTADAA